jgi:hypothetical protein
MHVADMASTVLSANELRDLLARRTERAAAPAPVGRSGAVKD